MSEIISILAIAAVIFGLGVLAGLCWSLVIIDRREPPPNPYDEGYEPRGPDPQNIDEELTRLLERPPRCPTCSLGQHNRVAVARCPDPFHREVVAS